METPGLTPAKGSSWTTPFLRASSVASLRGRPLASIQRRRAAPKHTMAELEAVAAIYSKAFDDFKPPTKAVAAALGVTANVAAKLVMRCRDPKIGLLEPTEKRKAGGVKRPPKEGVTVNGHLRKRTGYWRVSSSSASRRRYAARPAAAATGADDERPRACPAEHGDLEDIVARRQEMLPGQVHDEEGGEKALHDELRDRERGDYVPPVDLTRADLPRGPLAAGAGR